MNKLENKLGIFKSLITEDKFYEFLKESDYKIEKIAYESITNYEPGKNIKSDSLFSTIMYCIEDNNYSSTNKILDFKGLTQDEFYDQYSCDYPTVKLTNKEVYDFHIEHLFKKLICKADFNKNKEACKFEARVFEHISQDNITKYDKFISLIYKEAMIDYESVVIKHIRNELSDSTATYDDYEYCEYKVGEYHAATCYFEFNNPLFSNTVKRKPVKIDESSQKLWDEAQKGESTDVVFIVEDGEDSLEIPVHSKILKERSKYFESLFLFNSYKKYLNNIVIEDQDPASFKKIIEFLYKQSVDLSECSFDTLLKIITFAQQDSNKKLEIECIREYRQRLETNNILQIMNHASELQSKDLKYLCDLYFEKKPKKFDTLVSETTNEQLYACLKYNEFVQNTVLF